MHLSNTARASVRLHHDYPRMLSGLSKYLAYLCTTTVCQDGALMHICMWVHFCARLLLAHETTDCKSQMRVVLTFVGFLPVHTSRSSTSLGIIHHAGPTFVGFFPVHTSRSKHSGDHTPCALGAVVDDLPLLLYTCTRLAECICQV